MMVIAREHKMYYICNRRKTEKVRGVDSHQQVY